MTGSEGCIKDFAALAADIASAAENGQSAISVALLSASTNTYHRFYKNIGFLHSLQQELQACGYGSYLLFFEEDIEILAEAAAAGIVGYNIKFSELSALTDIEVFLVVEVAEFLNFCDFPPESKVVIYPHHMNLLAAHEAGGKIWEYWLAKVMSSQADYILLPSSAEKIKQIPRQEWENFFAGSAPQQGVRGSERLRLIPAGYFDLDYAVGRLTDSAVTAVDGIVAGDDIILVAPLEASFDYIKQHELLQLVGALAVNIPAVKIVVRIAPHDEVTLATLANAEFPGNVIVDSTEMFSELAGYRSLLLITEAMSNIRFSYPLANFAPVLEYDKNSGDQLYDVINGYRSGSFERIVEAAKEIAGNVQLQQSWRERLQEAAPKMVSNYGSAVSYFIDCLKTIVRGESRSEWVDIAKINFPLENPAADDYAAVIERNYRGHGSPYAIVYYSKLIKKGLELYPESPALNYYAGKLKAFSQNTPELSHGSDGGYYFNYILENYPQYFQSINWETTELAELLRYKFMGTGNIERFAFIDFMKRLLQALGSSEAGKKVIFEMLNKYT